eukprot:679392-Pelagomonas_calceolata.AAC.2
MDTSLAKHRYLVTRLHWNLTFSQGTKAAGLCQPWTQAPPSTDTHKQMTANRDGSLLGLEAAIVYIRVKVAFVAYICEFRGPLWGGRVLGGRGPRKGSQLPRTTPPYPHKAINI